MQYELERPDGLDGRQFELAIRRLADGLAYGTDRSPFLGAGLEYAQSRRYAPGDPVRTIDWRVTGRTGRYHVKEFEAPRRMPAYLLVDTSASMTVSSIARSKYAVAVQLAGGLALACLERASPVGLLGIGERALHFRPSLSRGQILEWLHLLRRYRVDEQTTIGRRLAELGPALSERSLVVCLSDLHDPQAIPALKRLAHQHDTVAIQLIDPAEEGLSGAGFLRAQEAETGRGFATPAARCWTDSEAAGRELRRARVDHLPLRTDRPLVHRLRQFLAARGLLGRGAR
jgi:uncharacterized protein (DUF58 family)